MKRCLIVALAVAAVPTAANAEYVVAVYENRGKCVSAWSRLNNDNRRLENRRTGSVVGQGEWVDDYYCRKSRWGWLLVAR